MSKILIIKVGNTLPFLIPKHGDYEDWIISGMQVKLSDTLVVDVRKDNALPEFDKIAGIVITGSGAMVTDYKDWSERLAQWLPKSVEKEIPILGICYGHQLLAYAFGGEVGDNPHGRELGTIELSLKDRAQKDKLLGELPTNIKSFASHKQSVLKLPEVAVSLAYNDVDENQAFKIGDYAWGLQFHPEFYSEIAKEYIRNRRLELLQENKNPEDLIKTCVDTPYGSKILKNFAEIIKVKSSFK